MINLVLYILILIALFKYLFPFIGKTLERRDKERGINSTPYRRKPLYWGIVLLIVIIYTLIFPTHIKPQPSTKKATYIEQNRTIDTQEDRALIENSSTEKERSFRPKWKEEYNLKSGPKG